MFRILGLFLVLVINCSSGDNVLFQESGRRVIYDSTDKLVEKNRVNFNTVDNIFQIPIAVIEGTSNAAQSWYPQNGDSINKVFDIPVQTLQAVNNLVKDRLTNSQNKVSEENEQSEEGDLKTRKRHSYLGWNFPLGDLFFGHDQGHGHKKKKRKPHILNSHFGNHGHHGHFGSHSHNNNGYIGQPILGGDGNIYHVTETLDDAVPIGPWKPYSGIIQNKIAPGSRFRF